MRGARIWYRSLAICAFVLGMTALPVPGYAQTGQVKGKVVDASGNPVEGAVVTVEITEGTTRKFTLKTNKKGEYIQIGLQVGMYKITASKDSLTDTKNQRISLDMAEVNLTLKPGGSGGAGLSDEERKKAAARMAAVKAAFDEGVALSGQAKPDEAIAKFNEVLAGYPKCVECYTNIASLYGQKKDYAQAETFYKKAIEVEPNSAEAYGGLANIYNAQKKTDLATAANAQAIKLGAAGAAGGGGGASATFNQGVILWNAGNIAEAKKQFEEAVKLDPKLADAHYWLGMANLNEGKMPDAAGQFEEYMKLAPTGQYAEQAKGILTQIKK